MFFIFWGLVNMNIILFFEGFIMEKEFIIRIRV
jgi:hypothetical protein